MSSIILPELPAPSFPAGVPAAVPELPRGRFRWIVGLILYCLAGAVPLFLLRGVSAALGFLAIVLASLLIASTVATVAVNGESAAGRGRRGSWVTNSAAGLFLVGSVAWAAWQPNAGQLATTYETAAPTPAAVAVPEASKQEAAALLVSATAARRQGNYAAAIDLAGQSLQAWPDFANAQQFVKDVSAQATAEAGASAQSQAALEAKAAAAAVKAVRSAYFGYANALTPLSASYGTTLGGLSILMNQAKASPGIASTADWVARIDSTLLVLRTTADQLAAVAPIPPEMVPVASEMDTLNRQTMQLSDDLGRSPDSASDRSAAPDLAAATGRVQQIIATIARGRAGVQRYIPSL